MSNTSLNGRSEHQHPEPEKPRVTLPGTVDKVIPSVHPSEPDKAQSLWRVPMISIERFVL